jgi:hypothetical protein
MPLYLSRFSYTPETWARLIGNPEDECLHHSWAAVCADPRTDTSRDVPGWPGRLRTAPLRGKKRVRTPKAEPGRGQSHGSVGLHDTALLGRRLPLHSVTTV